MDANLAIDSYSLEQGVQVSGERTEKATVTKALREFIVRRKQQRVVDLFGKLELGTPSDIRVY